jgi:hypothetical protein
LGLENSNFLGLFHDVVVILMVVNVLELLQPLHPAELVYKPIMVLSE